MEIQIIKIHNPGEIRSEFIEIRANTSVNLKNFILSDTSYQQSSKAERKNIFWFPELNVKAGNVIRLYTRKGLNIHDGYIDLYWNLDKSLWKDRFASAYIIKIDHYVIFPDMCNYIDTLFSCD